MKLTLIGHEDLYAVEQLQLALFPESTEGVDQNQVTAMKKEAKEDSE